MQSLAPMPHIHKNGFTGMDAFVLEVDRGPDMKTTVELPDDLYRRAKSQAALRGQRLRDLVEEGLRLVLSEPRRRNSQRSLVELMKDAVGVVDSGVPDLGSNPKHLADFGRDARRHR